MLFDVFYRNYDVCMEIVHQILIFSTIFFTLANFATLFGHTKENAVLAKLMSKARLIFMFSESTCPETISKQNLVALPITTQELGGGLYCPLNQNMMYHTAQPL